MKLSANALLGKLKQKLPAPPPALKEAAHRHFGRYKADFWIWSIATGILTFIVVGLVAKIFLAGSHLSGQALANGQRVIVDVASGETEGNARHTDGVKPKAAPNAIKPPAAPVTPALPKEGLAPAPLASIAEQTDKGGILPIIGKDGTLAWKYYARPFNDSAHRPLVAIVVSDLGLSKTQTEEALKLPRNITLSFSPYAGDARKWATQARESGFETLVDLPMQSPDYIRNGYDPGPYGLLEQADGDQNSDRLHLVLSRFPGYVGALAPENESLTANLTAIRPTLTELTGHGVLFLYMKNPRNEALPDMLKAHQLFGLGIDRTVDAIIEPGPIEKQLVDLAALAKTQGYAIGYAHAYPPTLETLARWAEELQGQGVDLAPVSAIGLRVLP